MSDLIRASTILIFEEARRLNRDWGYEGVWAAVRRAIEEDGRTGPQVVVAGLEAARDPKAKTPSAIGWATRYGATNGGGGAAGPKCTVCGRPVGLVHDLAESRVAPDQRHAAVWQEAA